MRWLFVVACVVGCGEDVDANPDGIAASGSGFVPTLTWSGGGADTVDVWTAGESEDEVWALVPSSDVCGGVIASPVDYGTVPEGTRLADYLEEADVPATLSEGAYLARVQRCVDDQGFEMSASIAYFHVLSDGTFEMDE